MFSFRRSRGFGSMLATMDTRSKANAAFHWLLPGVNLHVSASIDCLHIQLTAALPPLMRISTPLPMLLAQERCSLN